MLFIAFEEKNVLILYVSITHKIIRHPNTQYIIYILQYEYPDVHQSPYINMELFNLMIYIYIFSVTIRFDS